MPTQSSQNLPASADAALAILDAEAARKAAAKLFYSAAHVFREYEGPFAAETADKREECARKYEELGRAAEQERREHPAHFEPVARWRCPNCHIDFPEKLAVCGSCGFDLRTGKPYVRPLPKTTPRDWGVGYTTVAHSRHVAAKKRHRDNPVMVMLAVVGGIIFLLVVLALAHNLLSPIEKMPANHPTTSRP